MKYFIAFIALVLGAFAIAQVGTPNFSSVRATTGTLGTVTLGTGAGAAQLSASGGALLVGGSAVGGGTATAIALGTGAATRTPYVISSSTAATLNLNNGPLQTLALATGTTTLTFTATGTTGKQVAFYCTAGTAGATLTLSGNSPMVANPTTVSPSKTLLISADAIVITGTTPKIFTSWVQEL